MRFIWLTALKDWRRYWHNPLEILPWLLIPLAIAALAILAFGGEDGPSPKAKLLIVDQDESFVSHLLTGALSREMEGNPVVGEVVSEEDGRSRMDDGEASGLLFIPAGFGEAFLNEEASTLTLLSNPAQYILPGIIEEMLSVGVDGAFYLHRLLGEEIKLFAAGPAEGAFTFDDELMSASMRRINRLLESAEVYINPPLVKLQTIEPPVDDDEDQAEDLGFAIYFLPSMLFMSMLFIAQGLGGELWEERETHTLRRVVITPQGSAAFLAGKLLGGWGVMLLVCLVALGAGAIYFKLGFALYLRVVLWGSLSGAMLLSLLTFIQLLAGSRRGSQILSMVIIFPLMMIGGSFFPLEAMPGWMAAIGRFTPNGWSMQVLNEILIDGASFVSILPQLALLLLFTALLYTVNVLRLRGGFARA